MAKTKRFRVILFILACYIIRLHADMNRFTSPALDLSISGGLVNEDISLNRSYHSTSSISGIGPTGALAFSVNPFLLFSSEGIERSKRLDLLIYVSGEILPISTIQGKASHSITTMYDPIDDLHWTFDKYSSNPTATFIPLSYNIGLTGKFAFLPFLDLFLSVAYRLNHDIYYYESSTTTVQTNEAGSDSFSGSDKKTSYFFNSGIFTGAGFNFFLPQAPGFSLIISANADFSSHSGYTDAASIQDRHIQIDNVSFNPFQFRVALCYSLRKLNQVWVKQNETDRQFATYIHDIKISQPEIPNSILSAISRLDVIYRDFPEPTTNTTNIYSATRTTLFNNWVNRQYHDVSTGLPLSLDMIDSIEKEYSNICCTAISPIPLTASILTSFLDSSKKAIENRRAKTEDSLNIATAAQRSADSLFALELEHILSRANMYAENQKYHEAFTDYINFKKRFESATEDVRSFLKVPDVNVVLSECQFRIGDSYLFGNGVSKNIPEAIKWYRASASYGNTAANDRLLYCTLVAQPTTSIPTSIRFKGFYIGMSISEAYSLIQQRYSHIFGSVKLMEYSGEIKDAAYKIVTKDSSSFLFDKSRLLIKLYWPKDIVDEVFNASDMSPEQFAQEFVNSYGIPKMSVGSNVNSALIAAASINFWEYISSDGVRLRIYAPGIAVIFCFPITLEGKDLLLEKVPTRSARSFD